MLINRSHLNYYHTLPIRTERCPFDHAHSIYPSWIKAASVKPPTIHAIFNHIHEEPEFIYLTRGRMNAGVGGNRFTLNAGDLLLVNPLEAHMADIDINERTEYYYMIFNFSCLGGCGKAVEELIGGLRLGGLRFPSFVGSSNPVSGELGRMMTEIHENNAAPPEGSDSIRRDMMQISRICRFMSSVIGLGLSKDKPQRALNLKFINSVREYIDNNITQTITTEEISAEFSYNKSYFCTLFKRNFGITLSSYVLARRIDRAASEFRGSGLPLAEIASRVGFGDYCYFSRSFHRRMGIPPSVYFNAPDSEKSEAVFEPFRFN